MGKLVDLTGKKFGKWTVLRRSENRKSQTYWDCRCDCGNTKSINGYALVNGKSKSCGCAKNMSISKTRKNRTEDLTGMRFGRLTVVSRAENKGKHLMWNCICDCGNTKTARGETLKSGETKSCGCLLSESTRNRMKTHGFGFENRLYRIWNNMKGRCYSKTSSVYNIYGARGITVCDEWKNDFLAFRKWALANGYDENAKRMDCTLDRINVDGNYCPENCRWVDIKTQANNRRTNVFITYNEETHTISEWAEITGIKPLTLASRKRKGWSDKDCIEIPPYGRPKS